jgi:hypothetical protein
MISSVIPGRDEVANPESITPARAWPLGHSRKKNAKRAVFGCRECGKPQARYGYGFRACVLRTHPAMTVLDGMD